MNGVENALRTALEGRHRVGFVITLIAVVLLVLGLPAADEYVAARKLAAELEQRRTDAQRQLGQRDGLQRRSDEATAKLATFKARGLTEDDANDYRQQLVQLTRKSGCQLRRLNMANAEYRDWRDGDHPLVVERLPAAKRMKLAPAAYRLRSQGVSLSVTGELTQVREMLRLLQSSQRLSHTQGLSIRPSGNDRKQVTVELRFTLYGLEPAAKPPAAA